MHISPTHILVLLSLRLDQIDGPLVDLWYLHDTLQIGMVRRQVGRLARIARSKRKIRRLIGRWRQETIMERPRHLEVDNSSFGPHVQLSLNLELLVGRV